MSNTHAIPDTLAELQALSGDLLSPCIVSTTWPTVPGSSLTLAAFATQGYARLGPVMRYIDQPAVPLTLPSTEGTYWIALTHDTHSAVSGWTRRAGSHYVWQANAAQPLAPDGAVLVSRVSVTGGVITAVSQTGIQRVPLSRQDGSSVAITGGTVLATAFSADSPTLVVDHLNHRLGINVAVPLYPLDVLGPSRINAPVGIGTIPLPGQYTLVVASGKTIWQSGSQVGLNIDPAYTLDVLGNGRLDGLWGVGGVLFNDSRLGVRYQKATQQGLTFQPTDNDTGGGVAVVFRNQAGAVVGTINTTAAGTAYNTSSDRRLKEAIQALGGALDVIQALRPVAFRWKADGTPGTSLVADEVQAVVPEAVTGAVGAVDAAGGVVPQGLDLSKLVPYLIGACQELAQQVQTLTVQVAQLAAR